jgi:hypothetical protein
MLGTVIAITKTAADIERLSLRADVPVAPAKEA